MSRERTRPSNDTDEPKAPGQPSINGDGTINANGDDLGYCMDGWKSSEYPYESPIVKNPTDGDGNRLGERKR